MDQIFEFINNDYVELLDDNLDLNKPFNRRFILTTLMIFIDNKCAISSWKKGVS